MASSVSELIQRRFTGAFERECSWMSRKMSSPSRPASVAATTSVASRSILETARSCFETPSRGA